VSDTADVRRPGRPRSPEAHAAILSAALELAVEGGLRGLSMEAIAARAGVGKATIYRRWKSKEALFAEALGSIALNPEVPDTGSARGDFEVVSGAAVGRMAPQAFRVLPRLMADAADDPELLEALHAAMLRPRRAAIATILRRGIERGELRADIDIEVVSDMLIGPMIARVLTSGGDPRAIEGLPMRIWDTLASGIATASGVAATPHG
jgi:AcrR family transcriptional regulator